MNIHETIIFIHIYMSTHKYIHQHMYKYIHRHAVLSYSTYAPEAETGALTDQPLW